MLLNFPFPLKIKHQCQSKRSVLKQRQSSAATAAVLLLLLLLLLLLCCCCAAVLLLCCCAAVLLLCCCAAAAVLLLLPREPARAFGPDVSPKAAVTAPPLLRLKPYGSEWV